MPRKDLAERQGIFQKSPEIIAKELGNGKRILRHSRRIVGCRLNRSPEASATFAIWDFLEVDMSTDYFMHKRLSDLL